MLAEDFQLPEASLAVLSKFYESAGTDQNLCPGGGGGGFACTHQISLVPNTA